MITKLFILLLCSTTSYGQCDTASYVVPSKVLILLPDSTPAEIAKEYEVILKKDTHDVMDKFRKETELELKLKR